jgi:hypothetical protein
MVVQDDARERELIRLFELKRVEEAGRADTDAELIVDGVHIPFELKSSTDDSVTTVRDLGPDHVAKWKGKHWLFGFYQEDGVTLKYSTYGSPEKMASWITLKEEYVRVDLRLSKCVPPLIHLDMLHELVGRKDVYSIKDAELLQKRQYSKALYRDRCDLPSGYSPQRMLEILQERCSYLIRRGSTLNNPHIPGSYFRGWERITANHAKRLRELVAEALAQEAKALESAAQAALASARATESAT